MLPDCVGDGTDWVVTDEAAEEVWAEAVDVWEEAVDMWEEAVDVWEEVKLVVVDVATVDGALPDVVSLEAIVEVTMTSVKLGWGS